jgi:hypothetical protein
VNEAMLELIDAMCGAVIAQGGKHVNGLDAHAVLVLVNAYRIAQNVRRQGTYRLGLHDLEGVRNELHQLPEGGEGPLWGSQ